MKFTAPSIVFAMVVAASTTLSSVDAVIKGSASVRPGRDDNKNNNLKRKLDHGGGKGGGKGGAACPTCAKRLPGYAFYGQNYLDPDFWNYPDAEAILDGEDPVFGEDYFVVDNFFGSGPVATCYDGNNLQLCDDIAILAELIYESDLLRCLLMSLATTVRDLACILRDTPPERRLNEDGEEPPRFVSNEEIAIEMARVNGWEKFSDILRSFGLENNEKLLNMARLNGGGTTGIRDLEVEDIRGKGDTAGDIFGGIDEYFESLGYGDSDSELAIRDNSFFLKCQRSGRGLGVCAGLFGLFKAIDASVCHYRKTLGCGADTCTKDLAFDVNYDAERLAWDLPLPFPQADFVADILSPCSACLLEESNGCSAFCGFYEGIHECFLDRPFAFDFIEDPTLIAQELGLDDDTPGVRLLLTALRFVSGPIFEFDSDGVRPEP